MTPLGGRRGRGRRLATGRVRTIRASRGVAARLGLAFTVLAATWLFAVRPAAAQSEESEPEDVEASSTPIVRLLPEELLLPEGVGTFDLVLEGGPPASMLTVWLHLDPERFAVTSITRGPLVGADGATLAHELEDGYLTLRATFAETPDGEEVPIGDGPIARIGVAALEAGPGTIEFDGIELLDLDGGQVEAVAEGAIAVDAASEPAPEALEDAAAQATALAEAAVQGGLPDAAPGGLDVARSVARLAGGLGPRAAWLALLAVAAGITGIAWLIGREEEAGQPAWISEAADEHRRSMV